MKTTLKKTKTFMSPKISLSIFGMLLIVTFSCSNSTQKSEAHESKKLTEEIKDVQKATKQLLIEEKQETKNELDSILKDFSMHKEAFEEKVNSGKAKITKETKQTLTLLKNQHDSLLAKIEAIDTKTENNWKEFKKEIRHDSKQFSESVADFFKDNT